MNTESISSDLVIDLLKDVSTGFFMFWHSEWFVWVLTVASTLGYRMSILRKNPRIRQAVGVKEKHKQISTRKQLKRMGKATTEKDK